VLAPDFAFSIGLHSDEGRFSYFLRAPRVIQFDGRLARTDGDHQVGTLYSTSVNFPAKFRYLGQLDISFVSLADQEEIIDGIADLKFNSRYRVAGPVSALALLRTGSGKNTIFPFSSGTVDLELGLSVVDTSAVFGEQRPTIWWASVTGARIIRNSDSLSEVHQNFAKAGLGVVLRPMRRVRLDVQGGLFGYWFEDGATRQVFFTELDYVFSRVMAFFGTAQAEIGSEDDRPTDYTITVGLRVLY